MNFFKKRHKANAPRQSSLLRRALRFEVLEDRSLLSITANGVPNWVEQGPSSEVQAGSSVPQNNAVSGAVQSIAVNPNNTAQIIVGTVGGGVWRTINANPATPGAIAWAPLTDQLGSLSIGAVAYSPNDATGNTFYAGTGAWSNSFDSGDSAVGLYRTTNAGATWTLLGNNSSGVNILATHRIKSIAISGQTILVGTINGTGLGYLGYPGDGSRDYATLGGALYRSTDGGATFSLDQGTVANPLPAGAVPSIVFDPNNPLRVFASVAGQGVFRSEDGGANWNPYSTGLTGAAGSSDIELAAQNNAGVTTLFAGVSTGSTFNGVFSASNFTGSGNWTALAAGPAGLNPGNGFAEKFQLTVDPTNAGVVYLDGEGGTGIFRYNPAGAGSWVQIDQAGAQNTAPHADSRDLKFLNNNTLLEADDGGIFEMQSPTNAATSSWNSFNGNLATFEFYSVAYDPTNKVVIGGAQDNAVPYQNAANSGAWTQFLSGDGQFESVDATSLGSGNVLRYSLNNNLNNFANYSSGLQHLEFNNANTQITPTGSAGLVTGATNTNPIVITSPNHGLLTGDFVFINGVQGNTAANTNTSFAVSFGDANHFSLIGSNGIGSGAYLGGGNWQRISPITNASGVAGNPVVITSSNNHRLNTGDEVLVTGLGGTYAALNGSTYYVIRNDATHFSLNGTVSDGSTAAGGFYQISHAVMLKSAIGAATLSGLTAADAGFNSFLPIPYVLNSVDPRQMLLGFSSLYEDADTSAANGFAGDVITNITANAPGLGGNVNSGVGLVSALVYGGRRAATGFTNVALVGTTSGQLFFRGEAGAAFTEVDGAGVGQLGGGSAVVNSIATDPQDWRRVFVVKNNQVWFTANITNLAANPFQVIGGGASDNLNSLQAPLGNLAPELRSVTVVGTTPLVGGIGGVYRMLTPPAGACPMATWTEYGQGLPNVVVRNVSYDSATDTLVVGTMGRGTWTVASASTTVAVNGTLTVTGDANANNMVLEQDPNNPLRILVKDGTGNTSSLDPTLFTSVVFQGLGGVDTIHVGSDGSFHGKTQFVNFLVTVDAGGQAGDSLIVDDSGDATGRRMTITPTQVGVAAGDTLFGSMCGRLNYVNVAALTVNAGTGNDTFFVTPSVTTTFNINGNLPKFGDPGVPPGDDLEVNFAGTAGRHLTYDGAAPYGNGTGNGQWQFLGNPPGGLGARMPINFTSIEKLNYFAILAVASDVGTTALPIVNVYDAETGELLTSFLAYESTYHQGVRVAVGDLNGGGIPEIVTVPGKSHAPQVRVFDLLKTIAAAPPAPPVQVPNAGVQVPGSNFLAYPSTRVDGYQVAVGDVTGDGVNDIVVVPSRGVATIEIFKNPGAAGTIPAGITPFASFNAFPTSFIGGATVATGDVLSKGYSQIVVGSGSGMNATVEVFDAKNFAGVVNNPLISKQFNPFGGTFRGGVSLATGNIDNLNGADIIIGAGQGGQGRVEAWNVLAAPARLVQFTAFTDSGFNAGVTVAAKDITGDGHVNIFFAQGQDGRSRSIKSWDTHLTPPPNPAAVDFILGLDQRFGGFFLG